MTKQNNLERQSVKVKILIWTLGLILCLPFLSFAQSNDSGGLATLVLINFVGEEMIFTIDNQTYTVPGIDTHPTGEHLSLTLPSGYYTFSGHVPGTAGGNDNITLVANQTQVLGVKVEWSGPILGLDFTLNDKLVFFEASLDPPPSTPTPTPRPVQPPPEGSGALIFVNYIGDVLTIDIDNQLYTIPANDRLQLNLVPARYTYSGRVSGDEGSNDEVTVVAGQTQVVGARLKRKDKDSLTWEQAHLISNSWPDGTLVELAGNNLRSGLVMDLEFFEASLDPASQPSPPLQAPLQAIPPGQGAIVIYNHLGGTLTVDIDGVLYALAFKERLQVNSLPGQTTYSAVFERLATNGGVWVTEDEYTVLSFAFAPRKPSRDFYRRPYRIGFTVQDFWDIQIFPLPDEER